MTDTICIPIEATYTIVNGEAVCLTADYAEFQTDEFTQWIMDGLHISVGGE